MEGVDAADSALRPVSGIIRLMQSNIQVVLQVDACGCLDRGADRAYADTAAKGFLRAIA